MRKVKGSDVASEALPSQDLLQRFNPLLVLAAFQQNEKILFFVRPISALRMPRIA
jgi:hypothetical protein